MSSLDPKLHQDQEDTSKSETYWRSLDELDESPELRKLVENEFPPEVTELSNPLSRRRFMQLMGASAAFASMTGVGCRRWPKENIEPLSERPDDWVPGNSRLYATAMELGGVGTGLLVTSYDGRPIKVDGNPDHPYTTGSSSALAQASILWMYDPDRAKRVMRRRGPEQIGASWDDFKGFLAARLAAAKKSGGAGLRVLSEATSSPTIKRLRAQLKSEYPRMRWHEYEPLTWDNQREGTKLAFGAPHRINLHLDRARVVLAVDSDLFLDHHAALRNCADFMKQRRPDAGTMHRFYAVESDFSSSGGVADHRLPLRSELALPFLMALEAAITGGAAPRAAFLKEKPVAKFLRALARDLTSNRGASAVVVGYRQPPETHAVAARINEALGNVERAVTYIAEPDPSRPSHPRDIKELAADMKSGGVDTLLILGGNPVYNAPADAEFDHALAKVAHSIHLSDYANETSALCTWSLPRAHFLESWGDTRTYDGTVTLRQPIIEPMYGGKSSIEVLAMALGLMDDPRTLLRKTTNLIAGPHQGGSVLDNVQVGVITDKAWRKIIVDGFIPNTHYPTVHPRLGPEPKIRLSAAQRGGTRAANGSVEVVFTWSSTSHDGRFANNGWLQETPDFMTKLTWDNAAVMSPSTARALGVSDSELMHLKVGGRELKVAAYIMPGIAPYAISIQLGYGRTRAGYVGGLAEKNIPGRGFDSYKLRTSEAMYIATGASVAGTGDSYLLATTQNHWVLDWVGMEGRQARIYRLIRETTLKNYTQHPNFIREMDDGPPLKTMWTEFKYDGHRWGMAIDLNKCVGCNACMLACQAENNVPIVGKENVANNREMHWIRIDRYFKGDTDNPEVVYEPVPCQQCELAPCENVCPVGATMHSSDGLNDMVYNRCIGTRYCQNNCPYKVRRFNFLNYHKNLDNPRNKVMELAYNPNVTVRSRGVMEKCTFCTQRIWKAKIHEKNTGVPIKDGDITPACAQACPTTAIVFGDLNDKNSRVLAQHGSRRAYSLLRYLNTKPRNAYLARIRNPNTDLG